MAIDEKLNDLKAEIRSILIPFQKGCFLSEFRKAHREMIGKPIPFRDMGYSSEIDFLYSIPDVVRISEHRSTGDYHLQGIADAKSMHIAKMVCRQKPSKLKPPKSTRYSRFYETYTTAPRFNIPPRYNRKLTIPAVFSSYPSPAKQFTQSYENSSRTHQSNENLPSKKYKSSDNLSKPAVEPEPETDSNPKLSPAEEFLHLIKCNKNGIALTDILYEYEQMFGHSFDIEHYGFSSVDECIKEIEELRIIYQNNKPFAIHESFAPHSENTDNNCNKAEIHSHSDNVQTKDAPSLALSSSHFSVDDHKHESNVIIPSSVISKLMQVAAKFPQGIWASDFLKRYEEVTNTELDLHSLGYKNLADLILDVPDIFIKKSFTGNKKDYIVSPVTPGIKEFSLNNDVVVPETGHHLIESIISNIRKILQAYTEGVMMKDFLHVYSINCRDSLHVNDLGFSDLESFLSNVKERVPLTFQTLNGVKSIHLFKLTDCNIELPYKKASQVVEQEAIPDGAVFPDIQFQNLVLQKQYLPNLSNDSTSEYFPCFVSNVINPAHLYIQLQEDQSTEDLASLGVLLDEFYKGSRSKLYAMKDIHIKVGAVCAALWPSDQHWYRAQILAVSNLDAVRVLYVDYGTKETIPKSMLRYLRKELTELPIQALRCCLSFLKPPNKEKSWSPTTKQRLLKMCSDIPLMAKIEGVMPDGVYSIVLCDTNGDKDVFINDVLKREGLAEYDNVTTETSATPLPEPVLNVPSKLVLPANYHSLNPLQALQAQYFLHAFAAVAPSFANNENYLKLLQQVSMFCPNANVSQQNTNFASSFATPATNMLGSGLNSMNTANFGAGFPATGGIQETNTLYANPLPLQNCGLSAAMVDSSMSPPIRAPTPTDVVAVAKSAVLTPSAEKNDDLFVDDDEEYEKFLQKLKICSKRYVKRVMLGDGYKIHVINYNDVPYASCGDISVLIFINQEEDHLYRRLQVTDLDITHLNVSEEGNEELFKQLNRFNVKGIQTTPGIHPFILLYPLKKIIHILNYFGHPSTSIRTRLIDEITSFNPNDLLWREFSAAETQEIKEEEIMPGATDDAKIERLCLYDLKAMNDSIENRRMKMLKNLNDSHSIANVNEIIKLENMQQKVLRQIEGIKEICSIFSSSAFV